MIRAEGCDEQGRARRLDVTGRVHRRSERPRGRAATDPAEEVGSAATVTRHTDSHSAKGVTLAQWPQTPTDVKRGYVPDGRGLTYGNRYVREGERVPLDDDLVLHFTKSLRSGLRQTAHTASDSHSREAREFTDR